MCKSDLTISFAKPKSVHHMSLIVRKPVFGFRPGMTQTNLYSHRSRLEAWNFRFKRERNCTIRVVKTKALISCAVTAQLICGFVFACAKIRFSHDVHHIIQCKLAAPEINGCYSIYITVSKVSTSLTMDKSSKNKTRVFGDTSVSSESHEKLCQVRQQPSF